MEIRNEKNYCAVITAYREVDTLRCLLNAIHEKMWCFVHVDKKFGIYLKNLS